MSSLLKLAVVGLAVLGFSIVGVDSALAVLEVGAEPPGYMPDVPYEKDPETGFEPIIVYSSAPSPPTNAVPEPSSLLLAASAALGLHAFAGRRRRFSR